MIQDMMPLFSVFLSRGYSSWGGPSHCDARSQTVSTKKNFAVREAEAGDSRKTPRDHSSCTILIRNPGATVYILLIRYCETS
jgi:hypothetical protein